MPVTQPALGNAHPLPRADERHRLAADHRLLIAWDQHPQTRDASSSPDSIAQTFDQTYLIVAGEDARVGEQNRPLGPSQLLLHQRHRPPDQEHQLVPVALAGSSVGSDHQIPIDFTLLSHLAQGIDKRPLQLDKLDCKAAAQLPTGLLIMPRIDQQRQEHPLPDAAPQPLLELPGIGHFGVIASLCPFAVNWRVMERSVEASSRRPT